MSLHCHPCSGTIGVIKVREITTVLIFVLNSCGTAIKKWSGEESNLLDRNTTQGKKMNQVHSIGSTEIIVQVIDIRCIFVYTCIFVYIMYNALSPGHPQVSLEATVEW